MLVHLLFSVLLEYRVAAHVVLDVDGRGTENLLSALLDVAYDSRLGGDGGAVGDCEMADDADLTRYDAVLAYLRRTRYAALGGHHGIVADLDIVGDLAEVV